MKTVEMELKELILEKYGSLAEFCKKIDLPWTTLDSILKRGRIDVERLADGKIVFKE